MKYLSVRRFAAAGALAAALTGPASLPAAPIDPGFDLFATTDGTQVDLGALGVVTLEGVPLADLGAPFLGLGDTDTIVQRHSGLASGATGTIDIELVALQLRSVAPVDLGGTLFDLDVRSGSLLGQPANALGQLEIVTHDDAPPPGGGLFDTLALPVQALLTFTEVGNPANTFTQSFTDTLASAGSPWCHQPTPGHPVSAAFPDGGFFPGASCVGGGVPIPTPIVEATPQLVHRVIPPTALAEPGALALLGLALAGLGIARRRPARC